jgi:predicted transcriptional regulator
MEHPKIVVKIGSSIVSRIAQESTIGMISEKIISYEHKSNARDIIKELITQLLVDKYPQVMDLEDNNIINLYNQKLH